MRPELELLAPARDADVGIEAINHGADAVYIGGPAFGARDKVPNSVADIERLARHAHRFGARIFVTLNTILRDDELDEARRIAWQLYEAGADALLVQDMGLLEIDLPPIQLHASTQTDIRTPEKARFLQDVGFSQMVLARELDLGQIRAITREVRHATVEFFIHGALCVAYSGQCYISHAHTGRSANRGSCSQECRLPYTVVDARGRIVAHDKHVLSLKDNNQSANLAALVDAGIRSFKIEGRYKDMGYVKNVTAHYRQLVDALIESRGGSLASRTPPPVEDRGEGDARGDASRDGAPVALKRASSGRCRYTFTPDPERNFNRSATDYFVNGRQPDIGAFDTPKHAGLPIGHVLRVAAAHFDVQVDDAATVINNGDALTWWDRQGELQGAQVDVAEPLGGNDWRVHPNVPVAELEDLRRDTAISRNRDMAWDRLLAKKSAERTIAVDLALRETADGFALDAVDDEGNRASAGVVHAHELARQADRAMATLHEQLGKLGGTIFEARRIDVVLSQPWFLPVGVVNALRRDAVAALEAARAAAFGRLPRHAPVEPPATYPGDTLTYLANVYNGKAAAFYARHGVKVIGAAYESHEELGEASLMITKHCVRWSLSLCPKQTKGVIGVKGTIRAEPLTLVSGSDRLTLRFDCKPCEMHVVGRIRKSVLKETAVAPIRFYRRSASVA